MADSLHEQKLADGVRAWNQWRTENPAIIPDLRYISLPLSKKQFGPINGGPVNFRETLLFKANLHNATLIQADLRSAELVEANLTLARLEGADLTNANLMDADLSEADLTNAKLDSADLTGADLGSARNLTQEQINAAIGDPSTHLPPHLSMPPAWLQSRETWTPEPQDDFEDEWLMHPRGDDDLYEILGVNRAASEADIHAVFRVKAKALHPDLNPGNPAADAAFRRITHAYAILRDPQRRARYDRGEIGADGEEREDYLYEQWRKRYVRRLIIWAVASGALLIVVIGVIISQFTPLVPWVMARLEPPRSVEQESPLEAQPPEEETVSAEEEESASEPAESQARGEAVEALPPKQTAEPPADALPPEQSAEAPRTDIAPSEPASEKASVEGPAEAAAPPEQAIAPADTAAAEPPAEAAEPAEPAAEDEQPQKTAENALTAPETTNGAAAPLAAPEPSPALPSSQEPSASAPTAPPSQTAAIPAEPESQVLSQKEREEASPSTTAAIQMIFESFRPQPRFGPLIGAQPQESTPALPPITRSKSQSLERESSPAGPRRMDNCQRAGKVGAFKWVLQLRLDARACPDPRFPLDQARPTTPESKEERRKTKRTERRSSATQPASTSSASVPPSAAGQGATVPVGAQTRRKSKPPGETSAEPTPPAPEQELEIDTYYNLSSGGSWR